MQGSASPRRGAARFVGLCLLAGAAFACRESTDPVAALPDGAGATLYRDHCAACHGSDGAGGGHIARALMSIPADLTRISERRGGRFPAEEVRDTIDGRSDLAGHRGLEMPRWGESWGDAEGNSPEIDALVGYLESLQRPVTVAAEEAPAPLSTRARMAELAAAVQHALPAVFSDSAFGDEAARQRFLESVALLGESSAALEAHARNESQTFDPIARSLAVDAERIQASVEAGELRRARFRFGDLLENCVACHARLPGAPESALGKRLLEDVDRTELSPSEELRVLLATRQFDAALRRYEDILLAGAPGEPELLDRQGLLVDYVIVNLRVAEDSKRPRETLQRLLESGDAGTARAAELRSWIASLDQLRSVSRDLDPLERAQSLLQTGERVRREADPGAGLVYDIAASGHLYRFIETGTGSTESMAEAFYLLGLAESRIRRPVGRERWDDHLEAAIRYAPGTATSRAAFQLYEENRLAQYAGVPILAMPRGELRRIEDLRALAFEGV